MADRTLDVLNLTCPLPVLKTRKALSEMKPGQMLEVLATDPATLPDIQALCNATRHRLIEQNETAGVFRHLIEVGG